MKHEIEQLTVAEINRQVREYGAKRRDALDELISIEKARKAGQAAPKPLDDHGKAVRERAVQLLNGNAASVLKFPVETARESELRVEIDAIDVVTAALQKSTVAAHAAEAVRWCEANRAEWLATIREIMLQAIRIEALQKKAQALLEKSPDGPTGTDLPMVSWLGTSLRIFERWDGYENPLRDPIADAIKENVITTSDLRKAKNV